MSTDQSSSGAEPRCRQKRQALGLAYPKTNCDKCGSIIRSDWRCAEEQPPADHTPEAVLSAMESETDPLPDAVAAAWDADTAEAPAPVTPPNPLPPIIILDWAYEIWADFQAQFTGGERPSRDRWEALMMAHRSDPRIGQPFQDCAIRSALKIHELVLKRLGVEGS
jgi:hypothetical protein